MSYFDPVKVSCLQTLDYGTSTHNRFLFSYTLCATKQHCIIKSYTYVCLCDFGKIRLNIRHIYCTFKA